MPHCLPGSNMRCFPLTSRNIYPPQTLPDGGSWNATGCRKISPSENTPSLPPLQSKHTPMRSMMYLCVARWLTYRALLRRDVPGNISRARQPPHEKEGPEIGEQQGCRRWCCWAAEPGEVAGGSRRAAQSRADSDRDGGSEEDTMDGGGRGWAGGAVRSKT